MDRPSQLPMFEKIRRNEYAVLVRSNYHATNRFSSYGCAATFADICHRVHPDDVTKIFSLFMSGYDLVYVCRVPEAADDKTAIFTRLVELNTKFSAPAEYKDSILSDWLNFINTNKPDTATIFDTRN